MQALLNLLRSPKILISGAILLALTGAVAYSYILTTKNDTLNAQIETLQGKNKTQALELAKTNALLVGIQAKNASLEEIRSTLARKERQISARLAKSEQELEIAKRESRDLQQCLSVPLPDGYLNGL